MIKLNLTEKEAEFLEDCLFRYRELCEDEEEDTSIRLIRRVSDALKKIKKVNE